MSNAYLNRHAQAPYETPAETPLLDGDDAAFMRVVEARRSIRVYDGTPVPPEVTDWAIDAALLAPNSSNLQTWGFHVVRDPAKKAALGVACLNQPAATTASELIVVTTNPYLWKPHAKQMLEIIKKNMGDKAPKSLLEYYGKLIPFFYTMGPLSVMGYLKKIMMFFRGFSQPSPREPTTHQELRTVAVKSAALGAENLMLAYAAKGFDTCPMEGLDRDRVLKILGLSSDHSVVMVISAGKRKPEGLYGPRVRFPRTQVVHYH